ncbi:fatty acid desaturase [Dyadobacter sp. CY312]|uniref:fatty acid desaturase n=1 Tax=Dyadobacter sp. CY312 TaxID=2907303 RepID=UPI001F357C2A|nr:fatty acid desaturase [Dyadobacter sp. CY312]MCE7042420.1 fatty acid desaturase [Dyadobacter sp. CY312]
MRILPYTIPVIITSVFIATASTWFLWVAVGLVFLIAFLRESVGKFSPSEVVSEYAFFHYDKSMANLKTCSGIFFTGFNLWIPYFLYTNQLSLPAYLIFLYSVLILNSNFAISLAHDLMHSSRAGDRFLSTFILLQNGFFYLESDHIFIHHRFVGTDADPATARYGENIYSYFKRSISARFKMILLKGGTFPQSDESAIIAGNRVRLGICLVWLIISTLLGIQVFICILVQYLLVTLIYESITYIQHYGLIRQKTSDSRPEPVQLHHAWNCYYKTSAYMHFMMPVHSIHHLKEENLSTISDYTGPSMPLPFASMMMTALFPSRWFKLMNEEIVFSIRTKHL